MAKRLAKQILLGVALVAAFAPAVLSIFGRWKNLYTFFTHSYALFPGVVGDYLRIAYYKFTLAECSLSSRVSFGTFFAHSDAKLGSNVYIGSYCILGKTVIGARTQIASGVQVLSGKRQHARNEEGEIQGAEEGSFETVAIGPDCWIGAAAVIMADVGAATTIGAGSVVSRPIPPRSVAVGNPARVIKTAESQREP